MQSWIYLKLGRCSKDARPRWPTPLHVDTAHVLHGHQQACLLPLNLNEYSTANLHFGSVQPLASHAYADTKPERYLG